MNYGKETLNKERLTLDQAAEWVKPKMSQKRFAHTQGVVATAERLAVRFDCDPYFAQLAAWLHDACKERKDFELVAQAKAYGIVLTAIDEENGHLLHGPVAAQLVKHELGVDNQDVLNAMAVHTLGGSGMSRLSKVVFLADAIEPSRSQDYTDPIWRALADAENSEATLNRAVLVTLDSNLADLLAVGRIIHPKTVEVRNFYLACVKTQTQTQMQS